MVRADGIVVWVAQDAPHFSNLMNAASRWGGAPA
jgi:hypothetical protein